ncbi:MAG: V-type ATP synthase subunit A [Verrucomicrobiota bacterium]
MTTKSGTICDINGNLITVEFKDAVIQNEVAYAVLGDTHLKAEVIRVRGRRADLQVFEDTTGLQVGGAVEFTGQLLSVELAPGLLGQIFDGLQNPLPKLAEQCGFFLKRGMYLPAIPRDRAWAWTPVVKPGAVVRAGDTLGTVPEGIFTHRIMAPFTLAGTWTIEQAAPAGNYTVEQEIARLRLLTADYGGQARLRNAQETLGVSMLQTWPVKIPIRCYAERLKPGEPLITKIRILDTFFPVARGGTYCIPGPFGAGKTVLQQLTSRHADVDVVIIAACGERAGEVVETLREFPHLTDPRTGRTLMERTIIVCNTSSMPVAAREASVYTGVTLAEYYRQMGLNVLLLADSTSRWAQALREMSGRLEEIPGEEAFPAYLESVIASFYERGGIVRLNDKSFGSVTIGGTVSPAGGNFEEPVTQATLKVVGAFHGLSRDRANARRFPSIHPLESWSKYKSIVPGAELDLTRRVLREGNEVDQMMKVLGEEGTSLADFVVYLKAEYLDAVYLQQDAYHPVDGATSAERQKYVFHYLADILATPMKFADKTSARKFFQTLTQVTKDWNETSQDTPVFGEIEARIKQMVAEVAEDA